MTSFSDRCGKACLIFSHDQIEEGKKLHASYHLACLSVWNKVQIGGHLELGLIQ